MGEARHIIYGVRLVFAFRSVYCSLKEMFSKVFSHYDKNSDVFVLDVKVFFKSRVNERNVSHIDRSICLMSM